MPTQSTTKDKTQSRGESLAGSKIEEKIVLKKSPVIGFTLKRLLFCQV